MKKSLLLASFIMAVVTIKAQKTDTAFSLSGKVENIKTGIIYLNVFKGGTAIKDSSTIVNGNFSFKGFINGAASAILDVKDEKQDYLRFFIEKGDITVKGEGYPLKNWIISGSPLNNDDKKLSAFLKPVKDEEEAFYAAYEKANEVKNQPVMDSLDALENKMTQRKRSFIKQFVSDNPSSIRSAMAITENYGYYAEYSEVEPLYNALDVSIRNSKNGLEVKKMLDVYKTVAIGQVAPDITQFDTSGNTISLSSLKGKYVLVDFWASWCGPCRRENPNIVKSYEKYSAKGLEIFGVSYDNEKGAAKWKKAIVDDGLIWKQVSDLKGWQNATSEKYYIKAIPSNVLLDKEGRIIAKNLFGKELADKLSELMN